MYINDVRSSNEYRLQQVLHTLKTVYDTELDLDNSSDSELASLRESSEVIKNGIVSESRFNTYNSNPEYSKHMLILEAVRLYLTEIAPKRRRSVREGIEDGSDDVSHSVTGMITGEEELDEKSSMAELGRKMIDYSTKQRPNPKDEREMRILNAISDVGDKLTHIGEPFGPRGLTDLDKKVIEVAKRRMGMTQRKTDDMGLQGLAEMNPAQSPDMQGKPAPQAASKPGMIKVKKDNQEKEVPTSQLDNMRKQGFNVVGDNVNEETGEADSELDALMQKYLGHGTGTGSGEQTDMEEGTASKPNYHKLAKEHSRAADAAFDSNDEDDFTKHTDLSTYYRIKAGHKAPRQVVDVPRFVKYVEDNYHVEKLDESVQMNEAVFDHDGYQASMARSELYRNTKYAIDMLKMIKVEDEIQPWIAANLTKAASYLDKIYHYLDYYTKFEPEKLPEDEDMDPGVSDMALGETSGSIARQNLTMVIEYSTKLFSMIQPGDKLEGWVAMKLTTASDAVSSSKHYLEYTQFEKHASDMLGDVAGMAEEGSKMSKKSVRESVGQMLMQMMLNEDQDLAQAQTLLAAKALSDNLQDMAEKVAKMSVEDLMPLVDTMKEQFGPEAADGYNAAMKQGLEALLDSTTAAKEASDNAILQLQGGGVPAAPSDIETPELEAPALPGDEGDDGLGGTPAAAGPKEEPLGRAKKDESIRSKGKALSEKWDAKMKTKEKDKGMWDGWTVAELKSEKAKLMKKEKRSAAEQKKVKQIDFAIRAKQKDKFGAIKESQISNSKDVVNTLANLRSAAKAAELGQGKLSPTQVVNDLWDAIQWLERNAANSKDVVDTLANLRKIAKGAELGQGKMSSSQVVNDLWDAIQWIERNAARSVSESKLAEKAPPGKKAEDFIKGSKADFKKRYGKGWEAKLYATAWKKFGPKSESYIKAVKMLEQTEASKAALVKAFETHKAQYTKMLKEGKVDDPLSLGYGLDGEVMLDRIGGLDNMIDKLKEMIRSEMKSGALALMAEDARTETLAKLESAKAGAPYGVMWKDDAGKRRARFFESAKQRQYWLGLNSDAMKEKKLVEPKHFDEQISKLSRKG